MNYPQGSIWRKWDLHIHSPHSILANQFPKLTDGTPDWDPYLTKLESLDMSVIGITDYFTIDGYKEIKKFKEQGRLSNIYTVLPNIEFRLKDVVINRNNREKRLNLHVIFSDDVSVKDIEEQFLHNLDFCPEENPEDIQQRRKLKRSNLKALGIQLKEHHERFRSMEDIEVGATQAVVEHTQISDILKKDNRFKGKYLIILDAEDWCQINWDGQAHLVRKILLQKSHILFTSNQNDRQWCLGKEPYMEGADHFIEEFKSLKPCIHGSDAHRLEDIGRPCAKRGVQNHICDDSPSDCELRYCWIKADPTFEGLKQILYEPDERVQIQQNDPTPIISNSTIKRIRVNPTVVNDELSIAETDLELNPFLVSVVGGKGAGKTALVDLVANCYIDRTATNDENSFVKRVIEHEPDINTKLTFKDDYVFSKNLSESEFYEENQIIYIAQGELEKYIGEKSDLNRRITDLIFDSSQIKNSELSFDFNKAVVKTKGLEKKLVSYNRLIETLEVKTSEQQNKKIQLEIKKVKAELRDIKLRIKELEKVQDAAHKKTAELKQEKLGKLKSKHEDLTELLSSIDRAIEILEDNYAEFNLLILNINELVTKVGIDAKEFPKLSYSEKDRLSMLADVTKEKILEVEQNIGKEQKELEKLEHGVKRFAKLLERNREYLRKLKREEDKKQQFEKDQEQLRNKEEERKQIMRDLIESIIMQKEKYEEIIEVYSKGKDVILSDIEFVAEILFNKDDFVTKAQNIFDNRKIVVLDFDKKSSEFDNLFILVHDIITGDRNKIDELINEIERSYNANNTKLKGAPVTIGHLYDLLYSNYMQVIPLIKYKNTYLDKLSLGQKATVLIKVYLAHGDKPIIIDSHDDHLDNEFIMDELVKAIRQAKNIRQVILVSNNGNVVINSDSEQIIVANREEVEISYISGAIENPKIRNRALKVLEGGETAFQKRQEKYRL